MNKIFVMLLLILSGCASQQSVEGVNRSLIGLSTAYNSHVQSMEKAHNAIFNDVTELRNRVCELESKVDRITKLLDKRFTEKVRK